LAELIVEAFTVGLLMANCYVVGCEKSERAVIIDPGFGSKESKRIFERVSERGLEIECVVNTHGHIDHTCGNGLVKEKMSVPLLIHKGDATMLTDSRINLSEGVGMTNWASPPADRLLEEGDVIDVGELSFKVIHTPGHSRGSISILGEDVVFTGDTLFAGSIGRTDFPGSSTEMIIHSIRNKLMKLPDDMKVYPGHGPSSTIGQEKRSNPFVRNFLQS
jgi:hydroxyacylglutathione hydrolase